MATNPDPARITAAMWRLWTEFDAQAPATRLGGIYARKPGYHNTRNAVGSGDYSRQYAADLRGPGDKSAAVDLTFPDAQAGDYRTIIRYTRRLDESARARDPRLYVGSTPVLREVIGTLDGSRPYAYDLQRRRGDNSRDPSHLWHIHLSITRQFVNDWAALSGVLSVLKGDSIVALTNADMRTMMEWDPGDATGIGNWSWRADFKTNKTVQARYAWWLGPEEAHAARVEAAAGRAEVAALRREQAAGQAAILAAVGGQNVAQVVERALEGAAVRERAERATEAQQLAAGLADALRAALADGIDDDVLRDTVAGAVRQVFGSLDEPDTEV